MQVQIKNISKYFGPIRANDDISFTFETGRIYAILGENGAGKSTLMKIISGFQQPTHGHIAIDGQPVKIASPLDAIRHGIGMLYQDPQDFAPLTVLENFMSGRPMGLLLPARQARAKFLTQCDDLGFDLNPSALVESLTIGERQQLEIVRLLSLGVRFLILDEPTTGISAEQRAQLFTTLQKLARDDQMTIILVSHKFRDVEELCEEVLVLRQGKLVGAEALPCPTERLVEMMFGQRLALSEKVPSQAKPTPLLTVRHLNVQARLFAIHDINLTVREGEVIGLAGLDGSGQVDFMHALAGLRRPAWADHLMSGLVLVVLWVFFGMFFKETPTLVGLLRGTAVALVLVPSAWQMPLVRRQLQKIAVWGQNAINQNAAAQLDAVPTVELAGRNIYGYGYRDLLTQGVVYLPAGRLEEGLVAGLNLVQHFALAERRAKPWINWFRAWQRAEQAIETYDIRGRPENPIQALSGGNQQRVALALLPDNLKLLVLENPTRGLDVESARRIWSLLLARREAGTAIIFSSPDLDEILDYSDRVLVFSSGRVTLVDDPSHLTTARLGELIGGKF